MTTTGTIPAAEALALADLITPTDRGIASRVLAKTGGGNVTLFAFDQGEGLSEHTAPFDALVMVLAGDFAITVGGKPLAYELALQQKYQMISGTVRVGGRSVKLEDARLRGDQISFSFSVVVNGNPLKHEFSGRVMDKGIEGTVNLAGSRTRGQLEWKAARSVKAGQSAGATLVAWAR